MKIRAQLEAGAPGWNHNEALPVRSALKAGGLSATNHSESLQVRRALKAVGVQPNHNESLRREPERTAISMRRELRTTAPKADRLELLVIRAGLRSGARARYVRDRRV